MNSCRVCGTSRPPDAVDSADGWHEGMCPSCLAERNARARKRVNRIAVGAAQAFADLKGWNNTRTFTVISLPDMAIRSHWLENGMGQIDSQDAQRVWRELGEGSFLVRMASETERMYLVVEVEGGEIVDKERVTEQEVAMLPRALETFGSVPLLEGKA